MPINLKLNLKNLEKKHDYQFKLNKKILQKRKKMNKKNKNDVLIFKIIKYTFFKKKTINYF